MSAVLCGKRSYFDESPVVVSKKLRCCSPFQPPSPPSLLQQLLSLFPHMETQLLERSLVECGYDIDSAIKSLHKLNLGFAEVDSPSAAELHPDLEKGTTTTDGTAASLKDPLAQEGSLPLNGAEWVELFVREMSSAASVDDARSRATRLLESLEKSITQRVGVETAQSFQKENTLLKEQVQVFLRENNILKRAVAIQHERQKEFDERNQEVQHLKQVVSQYQEQLRTLEVNNYALSMHLKQSMENNSMPGSSNRDVF